MPKLAIRRGDTLDREIELADQDLRIGRGEQNDVVLPDTTKAVSRFHAELRSEHGRYVLLDLNSQNGLWSGGKRHQKIALEPGVPVTIGPYTLTLSGPSPNRATSETMPGVQTAGPRPGDTLPRATAQMAPPPPRSEPPPAIDRTPPPKAAARPGTKAGAAPSPGLIAALARMPKPLLFGGFAVFMILVMALGQLVGPAGTSDSIVSDDPPPSDQKSGPTNEELKRQHLTEAQALFARGDFEGAIREVDKILVFDPASIEAIELRAKAEDGKAKLVSTIPAEPPPPSPLEPEGRTPRGGAESRPVARGAPVAPAGRAGSAGQGEPALGGQQSQGERQGSGGGRGGGVKPDPYADRYARARAALEAGSFGEAIDLLNEIQRGDSAYRDTDALLMKAREGQRGLAQKALEEGTRLENAGDWVASVQQYGRAKMLDPSFAGVADESAKRVRSRMSTEGADAYTRARQADAVGRTADAIMFYERAARFLPDDDPNKKTAQDRLDVLGAKR